MTRGDQDAVRIPYERIVAVVARGPLLEFTTSTGGDYLFRDIGSAMGSDKHAIITAEITRRVHHRETVELPDLSKAEVVNRPLDEGRAAEWLTVGDFDRRDAANQAAIARRLLPP